MITVKRKDGSTRIVNIMHDESDGSYRFVNQSSKHVCKCKFTSLKNALYDLVEQEDVVSFNVSKPISNETTRSL